MYQLLQILIFSIIILNVTSSKFQCDHNQTRKTFSNSELRTLEDHHFRNCQQMEILSFDRNNLSIIEPLAFQGLKAIKEILISNNQIKSLNGSLKSIPTLKRIYLNSTEIDVIDKDFFDGCLELVIIEITYGQLRLIKDGAFDHLKNLVEVTLYYNQLIHLPVIASVSIDASNNQIIEAILSEKTENFVITNNNLKALECPEKLKLFIFVAINNSLNDWSCILKMKSLSFLFLSFNKFTYLPNLKSLRNLTFLYYTSMNGSLDILDLCGSEKITHLATNSLKSYNNLRNFLPNLQILQVNILHWNCSYLKSVYCTLRKQMIQLNTDDERDRESQKYFNCENFIHYIKIQNNIELENEEFVNVKHDYRLESKELQ
jgi:Leucine-rich repeat (LRR) protein